MKPEKVEGNKVTFGDEHYTAIRDKISEAQGMTEDLDKLSQVQKVDLIIKQNDLLVTMLEKIYRVIKVG